MYVGSYAKALNLRQMRQLHAVDLYALLWAYSDAVSLANGKEELPSVVY